VERLKVWRSKLADELQQPAFFVLSNSVLFDIATRQPMTLAELAAIKGIGTRKLEAWGEDLLRIIGDPAA
ncbi:MAG TPA: HRDC domain-containing protein, partial [Herpetosiphonaceae bacterium]